MNGRHRVSHYTALYCATTALDGYPSHSDKIHYIWMVSSVYICSTTFYEPWKSSLLSSSLLDPPYFQPRFAYIQAEPLVSHIISSFTTASSIICMSKGAQPDPMVPIISETIHGMWWKARQWRF